MKHLSDDEHVWVAGGQSVYASCTLRTWHETGLSFQTKRTRPSTDLVVLHWTGSENAPRDVRRNMQGVGYSVHFVIDQFGTCWQMADADALCAHAAHVNVRAVGIEIINRGDDKKVPTKGVERKFLTERIHGRSCTYAAFTLEQEVAAVALVSALCQHYRIPMQVPLHENGDVRLEALPEAQLAAYRGVIGHLHTKATKNDCGGRLLQLVQLHGMAA